MGFGWLLIGYFFVSVVSLYSPLSFSMLAGYPMMILALWKLAPYGKGFRTAFYASFCSLPFAVYFSIYAFDQMGLGDMPILGEPLWSIAEWSYFAFTLLFAILLLNAINALCKELYLVKLQAAAMRNMMLLAFTYAVDLLGRLPLAQGVASMFALLALFMRLIIIFLNIYLFYGCYRYICPEGEELSKSIRALNKKEDKK